MSTPQFEPVPRPEVDVSTLRGRPAFGFWLLGLTIRALPRAKVRAAKFLGRRLPFKPSGVARTSSGVAIAFDQSNIDSFGELLKWHGSMDKPVRDVCVSHIRPGAVFYDVGANVGYMALEVAALFPDVEVIAFEPQPALARNIAVSAVLNKFPRVTVYALMLGSADDEGELFVTSDSIHASAVARRAGSASITCLRARIDGLVESGTLPPPSVLKVDVEGAEMDVFRGAEMTIKRYRPIIVCEADTNAARFGYTPDDLAQYLTSVGDYTVQGLTADGELVERTASNAALCGNLVALPVDRGTFGVDAGV